MNRQYRSLWNETLGAFVAAPEHAAARGKPATGRTARRARRALAVAAALACGGLAQAGPQGGQVAAGSGSIASTAGATTVTQTSPRLAINWQSFNTAAGETVNFVQPGASAVALNRVLGSDGTQFLGRLNANGQVFVLNPNGVLFGKTAQVSVGGLVASTLSLGDADFMAGRLRFSGPATAAGVVNQGSLAAADGGYVALLGGQVSNSGTISARLGSVALAAGSAVTLDFAGDGLLKVAVDAGALNALAANSGQISADGGSALLTAQAAGALVGTVVNHTGLIQARTLQNKAGVIKLLGDFGGGTVAVAGTLDASAPNGGDGGFIETSGAKVRVDDAAFITTLAASGKTGNWLVDPTDYTVAASGGDITGAAVSTRLATTDVTLQTTSGSGGNGDLFVNDRISWNAPTTLSLWAGRNLVINRDITAQNADGKVAFWIGRDAVNAGNTAVYEMNAKVNLQEGLNFSNRVGSDSTPVVYRVINTLGGETSRNQNNLQGLEQYNFTANPNPIALGADIDASATASWNGGLGFTPISAWTFFLSGLGHTINGLTIQRPSIEVMGMVLRNRGFIRDLTLTNANVSGGGTGQGTVGILVANNFGTIRNVRTEGTVRGRELAGGLVGTNYGTIINSSSSASVYAYAFNAGGLVGGNGKSDATTALITGSFATGSVESASSGAGGLVGVNFAQIADSYATGTTKGTANLGGLVAEHNAPGEVRNSYALGRVVATGPGSRFGGLIGASDGTTLDSFWDVESTGISTSAGGTGKTSAEMRSLSTYTDAGWSIAGSGGSTATWRIYEGQTTPLLRRFLEPLTISAPAASFTYNGTAQRPNNPVLASDINGALLFNLDFNATDAGSYRGAAYSSQFGYDITDTRTLTITPKALGAFQLTNPSKVYDGSTAASVLYSTNGLLPRDAVTITGNANFADKNAGNNKAVTATGISLVGTGAGNYTLTTTTASTTGSITPRTLGGVSVAAADKVYDGGTAATLDLAGATLAGKVAGDSLALASGSGSFADKNVGAGKTVAITGLGLGGADAANYRLPGSTSSTTASITPRELSVTVTPGDKVYDGTRSLVVDSSIVQLANTVAGDAVSIPITVGTFADKNVGTNKAVSATIYLSGGDAANYLLTNPTPDIRGNITPRSVFAKGLTVQDKVYDGGTAATIRTSGATLSFKAAGDSLTIASASGQFDNKNAGFQKSVDATATLGGADAANYALIDGGYVPLVGNIQPRPLTSVSGITALSKAYDRTTTASIDTSQAGLPGVLPGDAVVVTLAAGNFSSAFAGTGKAVVVSTLGLGGADRFNYTVQFPLPTLYADITPALITAVNGITAAGKVYDGSNAATLALGGATLTGVFAGDPVTLAAASGSFADKNVGTGKTVAISGLTLGGPSAPNYRLAPALVPTTTADITPKSLTVSGITADSKVYDGGTSAVVRTAGATLAGAVPGDAVALTAGTGRFADKNVGSGKTVSLSGITLAGADAGNYTLAGTTATTTADITPATISAVTGITAASKVYDGGTGAALNTGAASFNGLVGNDLLTVATANGAFADKNAGTAKPVAITGITLGGADAGNYTLASSTASTTADISARAVQLTGVTAVDKTYDGTRTATLNASTLNLAGLVPGDAVGLGSITGQFADKNVGTAKPVTIGNVGLAGADAGNYSLAPVTTVVTASIAKADAGPVVGFSASSKVYDGSTAATVNTAGATVDGLVPGDVVTVTSATGSFADKNVGANKLVAIGGLGYGGTDAGNYNLPGTALPVLASISARQLQVGGLTALDKTYDATRAATLNTAAVSFGGLVQGDAVTLGSATASFADKNAGSAKPVAITGVTLAGADAGNYSVAPVTATTTASIARAGIAAVTGITANSKVYDGSTAATLNTAAAAFSGKLAGDALTVASATGSFADKNAGSNKAVAVTGIGLGGADAGNYALASTTAATTASITPKALTVAGVTAANKVYDGSTAATVNTTSATLGGKVGGDAVALAATGSSGSFADKNVGTAKVVTVTGLGLTGADARNYSLAAGTSTTANITPKALTVTGVSANDKFYDGTSTATFNLSRATLSGKVAGDTVSLAALSGRFNNQTIGLRKPVTVTGSTLAGTDARNYSLVSPTGLWANIYPNLACLLDPCRCLFP